MAVLDACFSPDATIVALAHGPVVSLWDIESNLLLQVLDGGAIKELGKVAFIGSTGNHLVAAGRDRGIKVWDLLSCEGGLSFGTLTEEAHPSVTWGLPIAPCQHLLTLPSSSDFVVIHPVEGQHSVVAQYSPFSPEPVRQIFLDTPLRHVRWVQSAISDKLHFFGVSASGDIVRFGDSTTLPAPATAKSLAATVHAPRSIWQEMFGNDAYLNDLDGTVSATPLPGREKTSKSGKLSDIFDGPSHTMVPSSLLFEAFMEQLLVPNATVASGAADKPEYDIDVHATSVPAALTAAAVPNDAGGRKVTDDEIQDLQKLFKKILSRKPTDTDMPNGTTKPVAKMVVDIPLPNDSDGDNFSDSADDSDSDVDSDTAEPTAKQLTSWFPNGEDHSSEDDESGDDEDDDDESDNGAREERAEEGDEDQIEDEERSSSEDNVVPQQDMMMEPPPRRSRKRKAPKS
jgi:NET1-associated nuclear protein 1 (U3 small nucleolar RNA-associated protein 17)